MDTQPGLAEACEYGEVLKRRESFLVDLNNTAAYALARGAPIFLLDHIRFLVEYVDKWLTESPGIEGVVAQTLVGQAPRWISSPSEFIVSRLLKAERLPWRGRLFVVIAPLLLPFLFIVPAQFIWSVFSSAWHVLKKGIRSVPPLITAVVVVFVTSDAWKILGTGFTPRFFGLFGVFLAAGLAFLIRFGDYWDYDIAASEYEAGVLLRGVRRRRTKKFYELVRAGAEPSPMVKPTGRGAVSVYMGYLLLSAFSIIVAAIFVSGTLMLVGLILINAKETTNLAGSVYVYQTFPGKIVLTRQLVSLSLSLGAFSAFFLVAAQHTEDRRVFMYNVLVRLRRALLVYSVYCRARDSAEEWTGIRVGTAMLAQRVQAQERVWEAATRVAERYCGNAGVIVASPCSQARRKAISWARELATAKELQYVAEYAGPVGEFRAPDSMLVVPAPDSGDIAARCISYPGRTDWEAFQSAAREIWNAVGHLRPSPQALKDMGLPAADGVLRYDATHLHAPGSSRLPRPPRIPLTPRSRV